MNSFGLPRNRILRGKTVFGQIYENGTVFSNPVFVLRLLKIQPPGTGFEPVLAGFSVSKKNGNAVFRNQMKRRMREWYRLNRHEILLPQPGWQLILVFNFRKRRHSGSSYNQIGQAMMDLIRQVNRIHEVSPDLPH